MPDDASGAPRRGRRALRRVLLLIGPLAVAAVAGYLYVTGGRYISTENAYVKADKVMIAAEVSGLISEVDVKEHQHVDKGDVLFRIEDSRYRMALTQKRAELAAVRDDIAGLRAEYRQKQQELALAKTNARFAKKEYDRQSRLADAKVASRKSLDDARQALDVARRQIRVIEEARDQIRARLGGDPDVAIEDHPRYVAARAALDRARLDLEHTTVRAPFAGIASNTPEPGQQVIGEGPLSSPVMAVVADRDVWIEANYKETELTHLQPGQPATIRVDTYPDREWHGRVTSISPATGAEFSVIPPQNASGNWVKVVQRIPVRIAVDAKDAGPVLRAGMSATVEVDTGHTRALPGVVRTALSWFGVASTARAASAGGAASD